MNTAREVSEILGIPASTLRRYVSDYFEFLSPEATQPHARRFNQTDLAALAKIRQGLNEGRNIHTQGS
jgi:DNA-binding transcriptional MerR regulator